MTVDTGLVTLFALVLADSLGIPAPGDSALLVAGALVADGSIPLATVIGVATAAAVIGDAVVFWVGRAGGRRVLLRDGRHAARRRRAVARADGFYARYGVLAVFIGKFIPGVRGVGALAAGMSTMRWSAFAAVNALACLAWTSLAVAAGYTLGPTLLLAVAAVAITLAAVVWMVRRRRGVADAAAARVTP